MSVMPFPRVEDLVKKLVRELPEIIAGELHPDPRLREILDEARKIEAFNKKLGALSRRVGELEEANDVKGALREIEKARSWADKHPTLTHLNALMSFLDRHECDVPLPKLDFYFEVRLRIPPDWRVRKKLVADFNAEWSFFPKTPEDTPPPGLVEATHALFRTDVAHVRVRVAKDGHKTIVCDP